MNKRIGNLEFRWNTDDDRFPEVVAWGPSSSSGNKEYCYTLARWQKNREGYDLIFIGNRPFQSDNIDSNIFWNLAKYGQKVTDAVFELDYSME
jgi:hypothetical protein